MDLGLHQKTALVTGSHRGTGNIIAAALAKEGAHVIYHGFSAEEAEAASKDVENASWVWGDLMSDEGVHSIEAQLKQQDLQVDILVNNFGKALPGHWDSLSTREWVEAYEVNTLSIVRMCQLCIPTMKANRFGRIINLGTIGSTSPNSRMPHYYAAKGALANLNVSLAKELANTGITVNLVSPGMIRTPEVEAAYLERAKKKGWGDTWEAVESAVVENWAPNLIGRIATREEIANVVLFLCGEPASFVHGQNIRVDGGALDIV